MIAPLPCLREQRDLYRLPVGPERFRAYLDLTTSEARDGLALPLAAFNPMAKPHAAAALDALIDADVDAFLAEVCAEAQERLAPPEDLRVAVVLADDAAGGWTHRALYDAKRRRESRHEARAGFAAALAWTGDLADGRVDLDALRVEILSSVHRNLHAARSGDPADLRETLAVEGPALRFAGRPPRLDAEELALARSVLEPLLDARDPGTIAAALFGDAAVADAGVAGIGMPEEGGLEVASAASDGSGPYQGGQG